MSCCDGSFEHPVWPSDPAGRTRLERQVAGFPEFRRAMLAALAGRWLLQVNDLVDAAGLAEDLQPPGGEETRLPRFHQRLRAAFTAATRALIDAKAPGAPASAALANALLEELNDAIEGPSLYATGELEWASLPARMVAAFERGPTSDERVRLHRLLLAAMFPTRIAPRPLGDWRARGEDDLGVMLLEMGAYVCDVLAFYDEVLAHEAYPRTARREASLRRLVEVLGYVPAPATAAQAAVALLAEGARAVQVPAGTALRSKGFGDEPPQVFETSTAVTAHPLLGEWQAAVPRRATLAKNAATQTLSSLLLATGATQIESGAPLLVARVDQVGLARTVSGFSAHAAADGESLVKVTFQPSLSLAGSTPLAELRVLTPRRTAGLWSSNAVQADGGASALVLDGAYPTLRAGARVLVECAGSYRPFQLKASETVERKIGSPGSFKVDGKTVTTPAPVQRVTRITLDTTLDASARKLAGQGNWAGKNPGALTVHYALTKVGEPTVERDSTIRTDASIVLQPPVTAPVPAMAPTRFQFADVHGQGVDAKGALDFAARSVTLDHAGQSLHLPVRVHGNVVEATRGESVADEVLGSGDATLASQSFTLKRGPLTYLADALSAHPPGTRSTLDVWVDGRRWSEVASFYGRDPEDTVYIVRLDADGLATVIFGDGVRGRRLPTGSDNVRASYRHGAGAATPPAGAVAQLAGAVDGIAGVVNPVAAYGGSEADSADDLRKDAPASALLLGRAVSVRDFEVAAAKTPGVHSVRATWRYSPVRLRAVATLWFIGARSLAPKVTARVRGIAAPGTPLEALQATGVAHDLSLELSLAKGARSDVVETAVNSALLAPLTGLLTPEQLGIDGVLFRSRLFAALEAVAGVGRVLSVALDHAPFAGPALELAAEGQYLDFETGSVSIKLKEAADG